MNGLMLSHVSANVNSRAILNDVSLAVRPGELHVLMGPNGSGKSTLAMMIAGQPSITVTKGTAALNDEDLLPLSPDARARKGLFVSFQHPAELSGVSMAQMVRLALKARNAPESPLPTFKATSDALTTALHRVGLPKTFARRSVNEGFSGGEKKRAELAQLMALQPSIAVIDEVDSGVDIDAMKMITNILQTLAQEHGTGLLLITHNSQLLSSITPTAVHLFLQGSIVRSGNKELAEEIEQRGYEHYSNRTVGQ